MAESNGYSVIMIPSETLNGKRLRDMTYEEVVNGAVGELHSTNAEFVLAMFLDKVNDDEVNMKYYHIAVNNNSKTIINFR